EVDLIEEVLRLWGMDRIESTLPAGRYRIGALTPAQRWRERIGTTMRASGLNETMTYAFADPGDTARLGWEFPEGELHVEIINPMSQEQAVLRRSLLPGLLRSVSSNQRHGVSSVHLYEIGSAFWTALGRKQPKERTMVAGVLAGAWHETAWHDLGQCDSDADAALRGPALNFFDGKGIIEALAVDLGLSRFKVRDVVLPWLQPGRSAEVLVGGDVMGWLGEVHPAVLASFEAEGPVVAFELAVDPLIKAAQGLKKYTEVPRFPAIELDIALVVDETVTVERVIQAITSAGGKLLEGTRFFDVYRGKGVAEGRKSLAFALTYRAPDRTLTDEDVAPQHQRLLRKVADAVGAELRG
ncbi:MAG: phenylalanine--tRNA ligase subunit beta, partial [Coriobacteriia bacterium]